MKIDVRQIPPQGLILKEEFSAGSLDLETDIIKFRSPAQLTAGIHKITNAVSVEADVNAAVSFICSRCLGAFERDFRKSFHLDYQADNSAPIIDINPDIRDEIMLSYPIKPLCKTDCKGLCPECGKNLNEGGCPCATT